MVLDYWQRSALETAQLGHNVVIIGQAGCGKTYVVKEIYKMFREAGKVCAVTCTTGIACLQYSGGINAQTIHR